MERITPYRWFLIALVAVSFAATAYSSRHLHGSGPLFHSGSAAVTAGLLFGIVVMCVGLWSYVRENDQLPQESGEWWGYALALLVCPISFLLLDDSINIAFDHSPPEVHHVHVQRMWTEFARRGFGGYSRCYIAVDSWSVLAPRIAIQVSSTAFDGLKVGDEVDIVTRAGFLGNEYMVGPPKVHGR